jgi:hypothetical protein
MKSYYDAKFGAQHADNQERDRCACRARTVVYCPQKAYLNAIVWCPRNPALGAPLGLCGLHGHIPGPSALAIIGWPFRPRNWLL